MYMSIKKRREKANMYYLFACIFPYVTFTSCFKQNKINYILIKVTLLIGNVDYRYYAMNCTAFIKGK